ncbi:MAG: alpha/beta hydrolase [Symbiopectobacterium sp.]
MVVELSTAAATGFTIGPSNGPWRTKAIESEEIQHDGCYWLNVANLYSISDSISAYPLIKEGELAKQAQTLANLAYKKRLTICRIS